VEGLLDPIEELTLNIIKEKWEKYRQKVTISNIKKELEKYGYNLTYEKVRLILEELWRKGEILIDIKGKERVVRPNHVIVNSRTHPIDFRNFTITDEEGKPIQRIWVSVYRTQRGDIYFTISESRWNGSWRTTNNIIIPPESSEILLQLMKFIEDWIKNRVKKNVDENYNI